MWADWRCRFKFDGFTPHKGSASQCLHLELKTLFPLMTIHTRENSLWTLLALARAFFGGGSLILTGEGVCRWVRPVPSWCARRRLRWVRPVPSWIQAVGWDHQAERWAGADRAESQHCREEWCDVVLLQLLVDLLYKKVTTSPRMLRVCPDSLPEPDQRFQPRYKCPPEAPLSSWPPAPTGSGWWCPGGPGYPTAAGW